MAIDTIGDFLTIIRNGIMASKKEVKAPYSKLKNEIAHILKDEGFIREIIISENERKHKELQILLKYVDGESVIHEIKRISTPGRRVYANVAHIEPVIGNLGISILTTNRGIMTNKKARQLSVGGEVICTVW